MACRCWFLLSYLWLSFAVGRCAYSFADGQETVEHDPNVFFAPDKLLPSGSPLPAVLATWRKSSHLRPRRTNNHSIPICYWLVLLGGDIETNPGPVKFPCTICGKPVKCNQMGVCCDECENWTHAKCCGLSVGEYQEMAAMEDFPWICPSCTMKALPLVDASLDSCLNNSHISSFELSNISENFSPLDECTNNAIFCHLNSQSLLNKMDELRSALSETRRPVILGVCETWLNSSVPNGEVDIPSYDLYRHDHGSKGGGILMYVPERCRSKRRLELESKEVEIVWIEMRLNRRPVLVGTMYRPPHAQPSLLTELETMLEGATSEGKDISLMGDLNINLLAPSNLSNKLSLIANEYNLTQLISKPTWITNHSQTLIDVLFTSNPDLFTSTGTAELTGSDHLMIYGECTAKVQQNMYSKDL